jgi:hypothetical protein
MSRDGFVGVKTTVPARWEVINDLEDDNDDFVFFENVLEIRAKRRTKRTPGRTRPLCALPTGFARGSWSFR